MSRDEILENDPVLTREGIGAACGFAAEFGREQWKKLFPPVS